MKIAIAAALAVLLSAPARAERTHTVVKGDCLWDLAKHYYQNPFRWRAIHAANTNVVEDPHWIYPKEILIIPDLPDPAVGELPARPVEAQPQVADVAPYAEPEVSQAEPQKAAPEPIGLSREIPEGLASGYPSVRRLKADKTWKEDGRIVEFQGREVMAAQGDVVEAKMVGARPGETYMVLRKTAALEEEDPKGLYLQTIGVVRVEEEVGKQKFRLVILKSGDSVQLGDLLKRQGT